MKVVSSYSINSIGSCFDKRLTPYIDNSNISCIIQTYAHLLRKHIERFAYIYLYSTNICAKSKETYRNIKKGKLLFSKEQHRCESHTHHLANHYFIRIFLYRGAVQQFFHLPIPGSIIGLILLIICLSVKIIPVKMIEDGAGFCCLFFRCYSFRP